MAEYTDREAFIPYRKADVIELCVQDGKLNEEDTQKFREFCEIVGAYYHFDFHENLEALKDSFAPYDPDSDTKSLVEPTPEQLQENQKKLVEELTHVLERANYSKLTEEQKERALTEKSLITLDMDVNFDDFEECVLYHRGCEQETVELKKFFGLKKVPFTMDIFRRVVLLLKFKDEDYFLKKFKGNKKKVDALNFTPGKMYIYLYKNIPQADLEMLFPNVEISMTLKDKLFLGVPAIGAGVPVLLKILPNLLIILGIIGAVMAGREIQRGEVMGTIIAALSGLVVVGGFIFKQYVKFKNKRIKFLKNVSDTLFFKNLVSNAGVFNSLIDAAEDEECKEVFLAYYHLLTSDKPLTREELDDKIEEWLEEKFETHIDFDVDKALQKMQALTGKLEDGQEATILTINPDKTCKLLGIDDSKTVIDYIWDNIFQYNV